jgi:hypothetical protein
MFLRVAAGASAAVSPVVIVLQFFSGVFCIFTDLPHWMQQVAAIFPLKWHDARSALEQSLPDSFATREVAGNWETGRTFAIIGAWLVVGSIWAARSLQVGSGDRRNSLSSSVLAMAVSGSSASCCTHKESDTDSHSKSFQLRRQVRQRQSQRRLRSKLPKQLQNQLLNYNG